MADFAQTMKDWARMCASIQGGIAQCDNCPLFKVLCQYKPNEKVDLAGAEKIIEKRAEDNPEPVYPTWGEWLNELGVVNKIIDNGALIYEPVAKMRQPIPADIAQELGIEPKEDIC